MKVKKILREFKIGIKLILLLLLPNIVFSYPVVVTDDLNYRLTLKRAPQRIVSLSPSTTEILFALKLEDKIVGVTNFCDYPPPALKIKKVGGYSTPNLEKIVALKPDLVIASFGNPRNLIEKLRSFKVPVFAVNPQSIHQVMECIIKIGKLTNQEREAKILIKDMRLKVSSIIKKTKNLSKNKRPRVFLLVWDKPLTTVGPQTLPHQLIEMTGGINIAQNAKSGYPLYDLERILGQNPDIIILAGMLGDWQDKKRRIMQSKLWQKISAVKNKRVYLINPDLIFRPGPRLIQGLEKLAKIIHPELFK